MKISNDQIDKKSIAGKTKDGRAVVYIATKGGLHAFFCKDKEEGHIASIGAAPHKAIAKFLASKKEDIEWNKDFDKESSELNKSEAKLFSKLRKAMFVPSLTSSSSQTGVFLVYDTVNLNISLMSKAEIDEDIKNGYLSKYLLIRDTSLTSPATPLVDHEEFAETFRRLS
jgi:hypothetical protein